MNGNARSRKAGRGPFDMFNTFALSAVLAIVSACASLNSGDGASSVPLVGSLRTGAGSVDGPEGTGGVTGGGIDSGTAGGIDFHADVRPVLEARCVACHACYDAPCQFKATAAEGLERGASKASVYNGARLTAAPPTRLFTDAGTEADWRDKGFFAVLGEPREGGGVQAGLLRRFLDLKGTHPYPESGVLPAAYTVGFGRANACPTLDEFDAYAQRHPEAGMPYGLPALDNAERDTLTRWLDAGAPLRTTAWPERAFWPSIDTWEAFFTGPTTAAGWWRATCTSTCSRRSCIFPPSRRTPSSGWCAPARRRANRWC